MLTRRSFSVCALCAVGGFAATEVEAQQTAQQVTGTQTSGVTRTILSQMDIPDSKFVMVIGIAEIAAGATVARHTHPGIESAYIIEGEGKLMIDGGQEITLKPGGHFQVPPNTPHSAQFSKAAKISLSYTVEKGKPLASPA